MSKPIGPNGLARIVDDNKNAQVATFKANALATKVLRLDPAKTYGAFASGAGPSDVTVQVTSDSPEAIANNTAKYAALKTYTAMTAAGGFLGAFKGATGIKITHVKNGAGTDDVNLVAALGGRFQVRVQEGTDGDGDGGFGAYTALTAT